MFVHAMMMANDSQREPRFIKPSHTPHSVQGPSL